MKIAHCDCRGPLNSLNDVLAGDNGDYWLAALNRFLRKENPWPAVGRTLMIIGLPIYKSAAEIVSVLESAGCKVSDWARDILVRMPLATTVMEVELVEVSVRELGFTVTSRYDDICARAASFGLDLCPPEVGPALRLTYKNQPVGEWFYVAMKSIAASDGDLGVFEVECDSGGRWLNADCGNPGNLFIPGDRLVFVRRK
jgi:hypothetical protein